MYVNFVPQYLAPQALSKVGVGVLLLFLFLL